MAEDEEQGKIKNTDKAGRRGTLAGEAVQSGHCGLAQPPSRIIMVNCMRGERGQEDVLISWIGIVADPYRHITVQSLMQRARQWSEKQTET